VFGCPIRGWVNISKGESDYLQPHIKRISPWAWSGVETVKETANVANLVEKLNTNRKMTLDLEDYTESMTALHHILTNTSLNKSLPSALPPFTNKQLQEGLLTPWTAEMIGRLVINYESEWYADESLSKWHEVDSYYQKQIAEKKACLLDELSKIGITKPFERDHACKLVDESLKYQLAEWQLEKEHRIKPSLWWSDVANAQAAQTDSPTEPVLSNLPANGKVWYLHPVGIKEFAICEKTETWDAVTNSRILLLHPKIRQASINFINDVEDEFGIQLRIIQGYRTIDEQNLLYAQGRTLPGKKVTWVKGGYSYHNYGLAI